MDLKGLTALGEALKISNEEVCTKQLSTKPKSTRIKAVGMALSHVQLTRIVVSQDLEMN